jgi:hypothetical protein
VKNGGERVPLKFHIRNLLALEPSALEACILWRRSGLNLDRPLQCGPVLGQSSADREFPNIPLTIERFCVLVLESSISAMVSISLLHALTSNISRGVLRGSHSKKNATEQAGAFWRYAGVLLQKF